MEAALTTAAQIASKSPVAVQGTKDNLNFSRSDFCDDFGGGGVVVVGGGVVVVVGGGGCWWCCCCCCCWWWCW